MLVTLGMQDFGVCILGQRLWSSIDQRLDRVVKSRASRGNLASFDAPLDNPLGVFEEAQALCRRAAFCRVFRPS